MQKNLIFCTWFKTVISIILFTCIACDCPFPKRKLPNGRFLYQKPSDRKETFAKELYILRFKCYTGYERIGPRYIHCLDDEWSDVVPTCTEIQCPDPPVLENAEIKLHYNTDKLPKIGSSVTYTCKTGYELNNMNASTLHCVFDPTANKARWNGEIPACKEKQSCLVPGVSKHGYREGSCCFSGEILQFSCHDGYELVGNNEIQCLSSGSWSSERPLCRPLSDHCELPSAIQHGVVTGEKDGDYFIPYDEAEIVCKPGYKYVGPSQIVMCEEEGKWEKEFGECIGPCDFYEREDLKGSLGEKTEEREKEIQEYGETLFAFRHKGTGANRTILDINFPGRLILYFVFDVSDSIGVYNFYKSIQTAKAIVKRIGISENGARAGALIFGSKAETMFLPLSYTTTDEVISGLDEIAYTGGITGASSALSLIREENIPLIDAVLGKKNTRSVIFIFTAGKTNMGGCPEMEADLLKKAGVEIYCIGITSSVEKESLYKIASTYKDSNGEHPNVFILENYPIVSWLVQEITSGSVDYSQCGVGMEYIGHSANRGRIINGNKSVDPWPWMAALYMPFDKSNPLVRDLLCGGSIINDYFILTAAHCMYNNRWEKRSKKEIIVKLGLTDIKNETYIQELEVNEIFIHPSYRPADSYDYDIVLLLLDKPIKFNLYVRPICLPPTDLPEYSPLYSLDEYGWTTKWGHEGIASTGSNERLKTSRVLKEVLLPLQSRRRCIQSLLDNNVDLAYFTNRMFCAGEGRRTNDSCKGVSGSPIIQSQISSEGYLFWTQIGIASWGIGCGKENTYEYCTNVQKFRSWIDNIVQESMATMQ